MKKVGVAILGLGVVGSGTYQILQDHREFYQKTQGVDIFTESVLEPDAKRLEALGVPPEMVAANIQEIVSDPDVSIVAECIGGVGAAREYVLAALNAGKTVVTSNKELFAKYSHELERAARRQNAGLYFEASCAGGVPVIRTLLDGVQANRITAIEGIINGTTNYILTKMSEEGIGYEEALAEAKKLGYAEADPAADVDGFDAAYKLSILASLAFHTKVPYTKVFREGISGITLDDIAVAKEFGYTLKMLAIGKQSPAGIEVRVHPALVPASHPLSSVEDGYNAVYIRGDAVGDVMLAGKGAGALPTGSAIVGDIIYAATHSENKYSTFKNNASAEKEVRFLTDFTGAYYLRLTVTDCVGAISKITSILGKHNVSITEVMQKRRSEDSESATVVIVTHTTHEAAVRSAVSRIDATGIAKTDSILRVAF